MSAQNIGLCETIDKQKEMRLLLRRKSDTEIVGWRRIDAHGLQKIQKQAQREGGQILILSPNNGSAAALSALPSSLHSKGSNNFGTAKENGGKTHFCGIMIKIFSHADQAD